MIGRPNSPVPIEHQNGPARVGSEICANPTDLFVIQVLGMFQIVPFRMKQEKRAGNLLKAAKNWLRFLGNHKAHRIENDR